MKRVGILALQGCIDPHITHLSKIGAEGVSVRSASELPDVDALILPGGESTTMLKLMVGTGLKEAIIAFADRGPLWGICAGSILLAEEVLHPEQESLSLCPVRASRNAYGCQLDSFESGVVSPWDKQERIVDFIRAPKLESLSPEVETHITHDENAVLLQYRNVLCSAFHTELREDPWLHEHLCSMI